MKRIVLCVLLCAGSAVSMDQVVRKITGTKLQELIAPYALSPRTKTVAVAAVAGACLAKKGTNLFCTPLAMDERELFALMSRPS